MSEDRPRETATQRADRNFSELLQELRVAQTGVQILFAFLLTLPLQSRFPTLDDWEIGMFVAALLLSACASVCLIAPVAYHRALFRRRLKHQVVLAASRFAVLGLGFLALAIVCAVDLVLDLVLGRTPALLIALALGLLLLGAWVALPLANRRHHPLLAEEDLTGEPAEPADEEEDNEDNDGHARSAGAPGGK